MGLTTHSREWQSKLRSWVRFLQNFTDRFWYAPLLGLLAALDNFVLVIPNDGLLISSALLLPKRWFSLALYVGIGSALGASVLAGLVKYQGLPWILDLYPGVDQTAAWAFTMKFFDQYGLWLLFAVAVTPFVQQPAVILAALAGTHLWILAAVVFIGRFIKFLIMSYVAAHTPALLKKMWGLKGELQNVGVDVT